MNILLVQAYLGGSEQPVLPLGLCRIAAAVKEHNVTIFDPNVSPDPDSEFVDLLTQLKPEIVGISIRNIDSTNKRKVVFYYDYFKEMVDTVRRVLAERTKIVAGGSGFSMFAEEIMRDEPRIDFGVFMEAESSFLQLTGNLDRPSSVPGVFYREDGQVRFSGSAAYSDISDMPVPYREINNIKPYADVPDAIGVETKRGCPLDCVYCIYGFLGGRQYRFRDPVEVVDEVEFLVRDRGVRRFTFVDSTFNLPVSHAEAVCREMIRRGLEVSWSAWFHDKHVTRESIDLAVKAGCSKVILSPDGFSDESLARLGKSQNRKDVLRAFGLLRETPGIEICYNFFKNPPGQSLAAFLQLLSFTFRARFMLGKRVHFEFNSLRIEPHTSLNELALEEGIVRADESLLRPRYYTNRKTVYIEALFNLMLRLMGK